MFEMSVSNQKKEEMNFIFCEAMVFCFFNVML